MTGVACGHERAECGADAKADGEELQPVRYVQSRKARVAQAIHEGQNSQHQYEERAEHQRFTHTAQRTSSLREEQAGWLENFVAGGLQSLDGMKPEQSSTSADTPTPSMLVTAATALGRAAGKLAGTKAPSAPSPASPEPRQAKASGKLVKKHKHRLPRRQKKALQREARVTISSGVDQ